jgi:putative transposase
LFVEILDAPLKETGINLGLDLGINKMAVTSDGAQYGTELKPILHAIKNCKQNSKRQKRLRIHRDNYIRQELNTIPWGELKTIVVEDLKTMKLGKSKKRSKSFRKLLSPWVYARMINWIGLKAQENRVRLAKEPPAYSSQCCPQCLHTEKDNRKGEDFKCLRCGYIADADFVGSCNMLLRFLARVESAGLISVEDIEIYA